MFTCLPSNEITGAAHGVEIRAYVAFTFDVFVVEQITNHFNDQIFDIFLQNVCCAQGTTRKMTKPVHFTENSKVAKDPVQKVI